MPVPGRLDGKYIRFYTDKDHPVIFSFILIMAGLQLKFITAHTSLANIPSNRVISPPPLLSLDICAWFAHCESLLFITKHKATQSCKRNPDKLMPILVMPSVIWKRKERINKLDATVFFSPPTHPPPPRKYKWIPPTFTTQAIF